MKDDGYMFSSIMLHLTRQNSPSIACTHTKIILEYIPIYWHLLCHIPKGVLKKISRLYCNFIRNGKGDKVSFQLARWNLLPCPNIEVDGG